jgi:hypothetical protein
MENYFFPEEGSNQSFTRIKFEDKLEVSTVSRAFQEHNAHLRGLGNNLSILAAHIEVANWRGKNKVYECGRLDTLIDKLRFFIEVTDDRVDDILVNGGPSARMPAAARRWELGQSAARMLNNILFCASLDREWNAMADEL